jgi:hypothetical protein
MNGLEDSKLCHLKDDICSCLFLPDRPEFVNVMEPKESIPSPRKRLKIRALSLLSTNEITIY